MRVLVLCDYFCPGRNAGGPIKSLSAIVKKLAEAHNASVLTRNRDFGSVNSYPELRPGTAVEWNGARVRYLDRIRLNPVGLRRIINSAEHDVVYLNSFFSPAFTLNYLLLRRFRLIQAKPVILAPRGELAASALSIKSKKKSIYILISRWLRLYEPVAWHVSSKEEADDLKKFLIESYRFKLDELKVFVLPPLRTETSDEQPPFVPPKKVEGSLRVVFVSRISEMKNLQGALQALRKVDGRIEFDIYGPREDIEYWEKCLIVLQTMPSDCTVRYRGMLDPAEVVPTIQTYDLFFLPTLGENFGHVILEALLAGRPALISNRTRWSELAEQGAGWTISVGDCEAFSHVIQECLNMSARELSDIALRAWKLGRQYMAENEARHSEYIQMFEEVAIPSEFSSSSSATVVE